MAVIQDWPGMDIRLDSFTSDKQFADELNAF